MDFTFSEDQLMVRDAARDFAQNRIKPAALALESSHDYPLSLVKEMAELGLMGVTVPEQYGGSGLDYLTYVLVCEEIAKASTSMSMALGLQNSLFNPPLLWFGTEEQKRKYLMPAAKGEQLGCFALSEAGAGSDAAAITTFAEKKGGHWVINGSKNWATGGAAADIFIVFAKTDRNAGSKGVSAFLVEKTMPGFSVGKNEDKMGIWASPTNELGLDNVHVPEANLLGKLGEGFKIAMSTLDGGRIGVAAQATALCQASLEAAVPYSLQRRAFGSEIANLQLVQAHLADIATLTEASRLLTHKAAWLKSQDSAAREEVTRAAAIAKLFATESATQCAHKAIQVHGGYGYCREYLVERYYRDARVMEIFEGSSEIQRIVIARALIKEYSAALS